MIINLKKGIPPERKKWIPYLAALLGVIFLFLIVYPIISNLLFLKYQNGELRSSPLSLGHTLFSQYLYPFEITSLLIIIALVGAVVLLKRKDRK